MDINGIEVNAVYSDENIENIFVPILKKMKRIQEEKGRRILVLLAAPPGAGKSTLLSFLKYLSETNEDLSPITTIGMDGFHRYQDYLTSHKIQRDGKSYSMVQVKGCPETFDLDLLIDRIKRVSNGEKCGWPDYNRMTHNPQEDAIYVDGDIVLLEGNYLLLNHPGWSDIKSFADLTISVSADEDMLRGRLLDRKIKSGNTPEKAAEFVDFSDMHNVRICLNDSVKADINLRVMEDGTYKLLNSIK